MRVELRAIGDQVEGTSHDVGTPQDGGLTVGARRSSRTDKATAGSAAIRRTPIEPNDSGLIKIGVQVRGRGLLTQHDREAVLTPGDFIIYDTSQPYSMRFDNHCTLFYLMVPRHRLKLPSSLAALAAVPIRGGDGLASLLWPLLSRLRDGLSTAAQSATPIFEDAILDLISAALSGHQPAPTPAAVILANAKSFIDTHLADPRLDTSMVAAAHHISVRYLQKLFKADRLTVAGWIRCRRLEHCRRDLQDPTRAHERIGTICARYGLINSAHFSHMFKRAYGVSPRAFREQIRSHPPTSAAGTAKPLIQDI